MTHLENFILVAWELILVSDIYVLLVFIIIFILRWWYSAGIIRKSWQYWKKGFNFYVKALNNPLSLNNFSYILSFVLQISTAHHFLLISSHSVTHLNYWPNLESIWLSNHDTIFFSSLKKKLKFYSFYLTNIKV